MHELSRRGLFGVFAGMAVAPLANASEAESIPNFSKGDYRLCTVKAYYPVRGFGFMEDAETRRRIFFRRDSLERGGINRLELMRTYWVARDEKGWATRVKPAGTREQGDVIAELNRRGWHIAS